MKKIEFDLAASEEAERAFEHYERINFQLGGDFRTEIERILSLIQVHPQLYGRDRRQFRRAIMRRFPYSILYCDLPDRIWIAAIVHHRQLRRDWSRRTPY